jgi:hypothetical protein
VGYLSKVLHNGHGLEVWKAVTIMQDRASFYRPNQVVFNVGDGDNVYYNTKYNVFYNTILPFRENNGKVLISYFQNKCSNKNKTLRKIFP